MHTHTHTQHTPSPPRQTGKPKHYAFVEFENEEVARIVAETMNGYFLYGKTLVVKVVPAEKLHPATFVGGAHSPPPSSPV